MARLGFANSNSAVPATEQPKVVSSQEAPTTDSSAATTASGDSSSAQEGSLGGSDSGDDAAPTFPDPSLAILAAAMRMCVELGVYDAVKGQINLPIVLTHLGRNAREPSKPWWTTPMTSSADSESDAGLSAGEDEGTKPAQFF